MDYSKIRDYDEYLQAAYEQQADEYRKEYVKNKRQ
jgi:hypothetical protein